MCKTMEPTYITIEELQQLTLPRSGSRDSLQRPDGMDIIWVRKGRCCLTIDVQRYEIEEGQLCILSGWQWSGLGPVEGCEGYLIRIRQAVFHLVDGHKEHSFLQEVIARGLNLPLFRLETEDQREVDHLLHRILKEKTVGLPARQEVILGQVRLLLAYLRDSYMLQGNNQTKGEQGWTCKMVARFLCLVNSNFRTKKQVADYAQELCVSPNHLNYLIKKWSGYPASYHIQQCVIHHAQAQARHSNRSLKEIAHSLGFEDSAHFSRYFKKCAGVGFKEFRNRPVLE